MSDLGTLTSDMMMFYWGNDFNPSSLEVGVDSVS